MQLVRDAERLTASEVAQLPVTLARIYEQRSEREQENLVAQPFFEALVKPWALEPSKLTAEVRQRKVCAGGHFNGCTSTS